MLTEYYGCTEESLREHQEPIWLPVERVEEFMHVQRVELDLTRFKGVHVDPDQAIVAMMPVRVVFREG